MRHNKVNQFRKCMNLLTKSLVVLLLSSPLCCYSAVGSGDVSIQKVEVTDSFFTVYSSSGPINSENCEDNVKAVFWREDYPQGYESMLSAALSAFMAQKKINMWIVGCKDGPWGKTLPKPASIVVVNN